MLTPWSGLPPSLAGRDQQPLLNLAEVLLATSPDIRPQPGHLESLFLMKDKGNVESVYFSLGVETHSVVL